MPNKTLRRRSIFSDQHPTLNSLFGEILDWMLAPLVLVWPISIALTNHIAEDIANQPYDDALAEYVQRIVRNMKTTPEGVKVVLPRRATRVAEDDDADPQYFQVAVADGDLIAGDEEVPALPVGERRVPGDILFRDGRVAGEPVRIAYQLIPARNDARPLLVQAAETRRQRRALSSRIISGVLLPQFAIIPLAVILVYVGLNHGLTPLKRLRERIRRRRPGDLSPIPLQSVPEEIQPVIGSLNEMMQRLEENLEAQQRFIADAAHQLKTPLTGLRMQSELALAETDPKQLHEFVARIAAASERASHLTSQLLLLARAEASYEKIHAVETLDLDVIARQASAEWVPRALAARIDLGYDGSGWPLLVEGIPPLLREMLNNLIDNAIKYTPAGGHVTVRVRQRSLTEAALEIEDTGIGIPEGERGRVFERFYRVLGTEADGSGLGLPIVREIADLHRATVSLSTPVDGKGTQVRVIFPCRSVPPPPPLLPPPFPGP